MMILMISGASFLVHRNNGKHALNEDTGTREAISFETKFTVYEREDNYIDQGPAKGDDRPKTWNFRERDGDNMR